MLSAPCTRTLMTRIVGVSRHIRYAKVLLLSRQFGRAEERFLECLKRDPDRADAYLCLGVLYLERVPGPTARAFVDANRADPARVGAVLAALGGAVARLHAAGLVHGDLTTSNAVCRAADDVVLIDFGLAGASAQVEDRAVDLYVLERALASTHRDADGLVAAVLAAYAAAAADAKQVLRRLDAVRARGRKRECFG